jgi:hypothetical protein
MELNRVGTAGAGGENFHGRGTAGIGRFHHPACTQSEIATKQVWHRIGIHQILPGLGNETSTFPSIAKILEKHSNLTTAKHSQVPKTFPLRIARYSDSHIVNGTDSCGVKTRLIVALNQELYANGFPANSLLHFSCAAHTVSLEFTVAGHISRVKVSRLPQLLAPRR